MESTHTTPRFASTACQHCGGECEAQVITLTLRRAQVGFVVLRNVPADVCQTCGESLFSIATAGRVMSAIQSGRAPDDLALIPIYDLSPVTA